MDHTSSSITADRLVAANDAAWRFWRWHAARPGEWTSAYLAQRGLRGLAAGLAPAGWSRLAPTLRRRGFTDDELVAAGLAVRATNGAVGDAFRDRLVLPIRDDQDQIIGFTARRNPATDGDDEAPAKYINTTSTPVYDKSAALYVGQRTALRASLLEHARPSVHAPDRPDVGRLRPQARRGLPRRTAPRRRGTGRPRDRRHHGPGLGLPPDPARTPPRTRQHHA